MAYRIRVLGLADGRRTPLSDQWVTDMDVDAHDGRGVLTTTRDPSKARTFPSAPDGWAYWSRQSTVRPLRNDGKPNRPLTAYTVVVEPIGAQR